MRLLLLLAVGCSVQPDVRRAAVTNASDDPGDPAVVGLNDSDGGLVCTGSLIDPHVVLTAAHCHIDELSFDQYRVGQMEITNAVVQPDFVASSFDHDLALLLLRQAAPMTPLAIDRRTIDSSLVGQSFAVVGYGSSGPNADDEGTKRRGTATVTAVGAGDFTATAAPSQPCGGDSGGPALFTDGTVSGVASHGDAACSDHATFAQIDPAFIDGVLAAAAPGSAAVGDRCFYDEQCGSGTCLRAADEPKRSFCSKACSRNTDCPAAMTCATDGCRYHAPSPGALGAKCSLPSECAYGVCQNGICSRRCVAVGNECPSGFACTNTQGIDFYCLPAPHDGGCSLDGRASSPSGALLCLAWLLMFARRRRATSR